MIDWQLILPKNNYLDLPLVEGSEELNISYQFIHDGLSSIDSNIRKSIASLLKNESQNPFVNLVSNYIQYDPESNSDAYMSLKKDIETMVSELIFRELGMSSYSLPWSTHNEVFDVYTGNGSMTKILDNALDPLVKDDYERTRAEIDFWSYLKRIRGNGDLRPVVMLSPHPEDELRIESGGYTHNMLYIYTGCQNEHGEIIEKVEQIWIEGGEKGIRFLEDLAEKFNFEILPGDIENLKRDELLMRKWGCLNSEEYDKLSLLLNLRESLDLEKLSRAESFLLEIDEEIHMYFLPQIQEYVNIVMKNIEGYSVEEIISVLEVLFLDFENKLAELQKRFLLYTFSMDDYKHFIELPFEERLERAEGSLIACNYSSIINSVIGNMFSRAGTRFVNFDNLPDEAECPACGYTWFVRNGDISTYKSHCPNCGQSVSCKEGFSVN